MKDIIRLLGGGVVLAGTLLAQSGPMLEAAPAPRQFDFWIGQWEVTVPDGKLAGTNTIEPVAGGAGLLENWTGTGGFSGKSLNTYNAARKQWQQYWVGSDAEVLELSGGLVDGKMVLTGEHVSNGRPRMERITWTPNADGTVRQHWEQSTDGGKTWTTAFDGLYRKKKTP